MPSYLVLAAMKGRFVSEQGHTYDNFQMMGYSDGADPKGAVANFFDEPPYTFNGETWNTFGPNA